MTQPTSAFQQLGEDYVDANKLIYQAGVDFEAKPVVVFCAASLPKPTDVDYDQLLEKIILKLDEFVENDYTCIMFVGGNINRPSWTWLLKAYRQLGRKYKKNLKNLYVVHPVMWVRLLMDMMNKIISPKFAKKVTWVKTLSELTQFVPLASMTVPSAVFEHNKKFEKDFNVNSNGSQGGNFEDNTSYMFGKRLEVLMGENGEMGLPKVVIQCMEYVLAKGQEEEGIFRRSPSSLHLKEAKRKFDDDLDVDLDQYGVHVASVLLKVFTRELPEPIIPVSLYPVIEKMIDHVESAETLSNYLGDELIPKLPLPTQLYLQYIATSLNTLAQNARFTKMTPQSLAVVWAPNLLRSGDPMLDVSLCSANEGAPTVGYAFRLAIEHPDLVFKAVTSSTTKTAQPPSVPPKPTHLQQS